jgi:hypothetical protein
VTTDDLDLMNDLRDLPGWDDLSTEFSVEPPTTATVNRAALAVGEAARLQAPSTVRELAPRRRTRRLRWAGVAVAGVAAAALLVAAPTVSTPGNAPVATASASEFLHQLAASAKPALATDAPYWRTEFVALSRMEPGAPGKTPHTTTIWRGRDGGMWLSYNGDTPVYENLPAEFELGRSSTISWADISTLGDDATSVNAALTERVGAEGIFDAAASLLAAAPLTQPQRQALFTILGDQPGLTITENVKDSTGRVGTGISKVEGKDTGTLVLATDGSLYEIRYTSNAGQTFTSQTVPAGGVVTFETYIAASPATTAPAK